MAQKQKHWKCAILDDKCRGVQRVLDWSVQWSGEVQFGFSHTHFTLQSSFVGCSFSRILGPVAALKWDMYIFI